MDFRLHWAFLRRILLLGALAALTVVPAASGAFRPIHRDFGERSVPLVRHGTVTIPKGHGSSRVRIIVPGVVRRVGGSCFQVTQTLVEPETMRQ